MKTLLLTALVAVSALGDAHADRRRDRRDRDYDRRYDRDYRDDRDYGYGYSRETYTNTTNVTTYSEPEYVTECHVDSYDQAYNRWNARREEMRRRGRTRAVVGGVTTVLGAILRGSDNQGTRDVGGVLMVGGAILTVAGLIEMDASDDAYYPHRMVSCRQHYVGETRRVVVERQQCVSTRYTERGFGSSRSYYEVNCQSRSYVTFEHFDAWDSGYAY